MRVIWKLLVALGALAVLLLIAAFVLVSLIDPNEYRDLIAQRVKQTTGRRLDIGGSLEIHPGFTAHLSAQRAGFENAVWGTRPQMVSVDRVSVGLRLLPLLRGDLDLVTVVLEGVDVLVETNSRGIGNWKLGPEASRKEEDTRDDDYVPPFLRPRRIHIHDATVTYRNGKTGEVKHLTLDKLRVKSAGGPEDAIWIKLEGEILGTMVDAEGSIWAARNLLEPQAPSTVDLQVAALGGTGRMRGSIRDVAAGRGLDLRFSFEAQDLATGLRTVGLTLPQLPPLKISGELSDPGASHLVENLVARVGRSDFAGKVKVSRGKERPAIAASLTSAVLDLKELFPPEPDGPSREKTEKDSARVISDSPLPLPPLPVVDAEVFHAVDRVMLRAGGEAHRANLRLDLQDGRLDAVSDFGELGGGSVSARIRVGKPGPGAPVIFDLTATDADLEGFLGSETATGGDVKLRLHLGGRGSTLREIAGTLNGALDAEVGQAHLESRLLRQLGGDFLIQLVNLINPLYKGDLTSEVSCAVLRVSFRDGVATIDRGIGIETEKSKIIGAGKVDLKTEKLDLAFRVDSKGMAGVNVGTFVNNLVRIGGTLAKPSLQIDPVATAGTVARVTGGVMTVGMSVLGEALIKRVAISKSACEIAREKPLPSIEEGAGPSEGAEQQAGEKKKGALRKAVDGVGKGLNRLLGR